MRGSPVMMTSERVVHPEVPRRTTLLATSRGAVMELQLKNGIALVTGGTRDVGREIALTLAAEGATVAVHHRSSPEEADAVVADIRKLGGKAKAYQADIADRIAV